MTAVYVVAFVVGAVAVLTALLVADFDLGADTDGLPFLSLTSLAAGLLGAGTGGLVSGWAGLGGLGAGAVALFSGALLILLLQGMLLPYLRRQESNSHLMRASYIGLLGTVTLDVPADGWGEVSFVDAEGNRVRARAVTAEIETLAKNSLVYIAEVDDEYLHVVAVPPS